MKVVFLGTPAPAVPSLAALVEAGHDVGLVVTNPDRPAGRSRRPAPPPVKVAAEERGLPVLQPRGVRGASVLDRLRACAPDVLVVVAYGRILPRPLLDVAPSGAVNVHFSLLPAYRGAAPVQWALARGERATGVSTMRLDEGMDTGPVLLRREVAIAPGEHAPALQERLAAVGARLLVETLAGLADGTLAGTPQDHAAATAAPLLSRADGEIDPGLTAREIEGRVRGFDPWPGVWLAADGQRVRLVDVVALADERDAAAPGTVLGVDGDALRLACGGGTVLAIRRAQPAGRRAITGRDLVNGRVVAPGSRLRRVDGDDGAHAG